MFGQQLALSNGHVVRAKGACNDAFYPPEDLSIEYVCPLVCQR